LKGEADFLYQATVIPSWGCFQKLKTLVGMPACRSRDWPT
jgi:hypothetical protein